MPAGHSSFRSPERSRLSASGLIVDLRSPTDKIARFLSSANSASPNYAAAERKLRLTTTFLIGDIDILQR